MNTQTMKRGIITHASELAKLVVTLSAATSIIATGLWFVFGASVTEAARRISGSEEVLEVVSEIKTEQTAQRVLITDLNARVNSLEPEQQVVEYDGLRSWIDTKCVRGQVCNAGFFLRRADTTFGGTCGTPISTRVFVDAAGIEFYPARESTPSPRRLSRATSLVEIDFIVPDRAAEGVGEFFLRLVYTDCEGADGPVRRESMRLVTRIVRE